MHVIHTLVYGNIEHQSETRGGGGGGREGRGEGGGRGRGRGREGGRGRGEREGGRGRGGEGGREGCTPGDSPRYAVIHTKYTMYTKHPQW